MRSRRLDPGDETFETLSRTSDSRSTDDEFETLAPPSVAPAESTFTRTSERVKPAKRASSRPPLSLRARAVGLLSRREHSRSELSRKLTPHTEDPEALVSLLDALEKEGWLSDARFVQSLVHRRAPGRGTSRIVSELRQSGVDAIHIEELKDGLRQTEFDRALEVWRKRFSDGRPVDRAAYAKQARFLASRGFAHDVIHRVLGDDHDIE